MHSLCRGCKFVIRHAAALPVAVALLAGAFAHFSFGQSFTSSITGTVTDPTAAPVQGVSIELKDMATDDTRQATSDSNGSYQFTNLSPGAYQITATAAGFKSASAPTSNRSYAACSPSSSYRRAITGASGCASLAHRPQQIRAARWPTPRRTW